MRLSGPILVAAIFGSITPLAGRAQTGDRTIKGTVQDSANNKPLPGAAIYLDGKDTDRTAKDGTFHVPAGIDPLMLVVRRPGYVPLLLAVRAGAVGSETDIGVRRMRQAKTDADREAVQAIDLKMYPRLASFYDRKTKFRQGVFLGPDDLQRLAGTLPDIIRAKQGFRDMCVVNRQGALDCGKKSERGPTTIYGSGQSSFAEQQLCLTRVWTDDVGPEPTLDEIRVTDILAVEAYYNPTTTPDVFPGSSCVTIRLWMKKANQ